MLLFTAHSKYNPPPNASLIEVFNHFPKAAMVKEEFQSTQESNGSLTAVDYISSQLSLEREAKQLMPYDPNTCTYTIGPLRQQLYTCLTCLERTGTPSGICYSCSIQCHPDHELVELFTKRNFTCDCGTTRIKIPCNLRNKVEDDIPSSDNEYNHNFKGRFCYCDTPYDPDEETGNMLQCILGDICQEDWFHDYCVMGLPKFKKEINKEGENKLDDLKDIAVGEETETNEVAIDGFPRFDNFDTFICWKCVSANKAFFDIIKFDGNIVEESLQRVEANSISERNDKIIQNKDGVFKKRKIDFDYSLFLKHNHESNFSQLLSDNPENKVIQDFFNKFPHLLKDEHIYEPPPEQDDDDSSIYDLGAKAINSLPREQAIEGVQAYENIKSKLKDFLAPFAKDGKIVGKEDIELFFQDLKSKK